MTVKATSRTGVVIIGYGDKYTTNRVIRVVDSLSNNNLFGIYYEVYSSTIYLNYIYGLLHSPLRYLL